MLEREEDMAGSKRKSEDTFTKREGKSSIVKSSKLRQVAKRLEEIEHHFQISVETLVDGFGIFSAIRDEVGHIIDFRYDYVNEAGCRLNRRTRKEQIGRTLLKVLPMHEDTTLFDEYVRVVETGQSLAKESLVYEDVFGGGKRLSRALDFQGVKLGDGFSVHWRDLTKRKQTEEQLQLSEQNFRNLLDNSPLGIRIITGEGELLYANQTILDIYGYSNIEELKAIPTKKRYTPESYTEHQKRKEEKEQGKTVSSSYEESIVRKNGEVRYLSVSRKEVVWNGKTQFQVLYQDITERKQTEKELKQAAEKWETPFSSITDLVFIQDKDYKLVMINKAYADAIKMERRALSMGADDYITKPFSAIEMTGRVRAVLRRTKSWDEHTEPIFRSGELVVDFASYKVTLAGEEIVLTGNEYRMLPYLARNAGRTVTLDNILSNVWGEEYVGETPLFM